MARRPSRACASRPGQAPVPRGRPRARNVILFLGDGMGAAHRTAARIVSRGVHNGKAAGRLAMDTLDVTGQVMTGSLNAVITDSSPGMAAYVTGQKNANNQQGVFPDNTPDVFDNPRIEYLGEILRRTRGPGFNVGIVTTADLTDSTPAANAVHTSNRFAGPGIAAQFFDERATNGVTVLLGGGANHFAPKSAGGTRTDDAQPRRGVPCGGIRDRPQRHRRPRAPRPGRAAPRGPARPLPRVAHGRRLRQGRRRPVQRRTRAREERGVPRHADARGHDAGSR